MNFLTLADLTVHLQKQFIRRSLSGGQILLQQYEPADWLFWLESGRIRLVSFVGDQMITHYFVEANYFFCESALYFERYECTAIAEIPSTVIMIPKHSFAEALKKSPALCDRYLTSLTHQFRSVKTLLELRSVRPARNRLLHYLISQQLPNKPVVIIKKPLKAIASELDLTPECISRIIAQLQAEGLIIRERQSIQFPRQLRDDCAS